MKAQVMRELTVARVASDSIFEWVYGELAIGHAAAI